MADDRSDIMRAAATTASPSRPVAGVRRFGWPRRILAIGVALSFAVAAFAWVRVISSVVGAVTETPQATPGLTERSFSPGRYGVFERTGTSTGGGGITFTENQLPRLRPGDVTVTGPNGAVVATRFMGSNETINQSGHMYTGVVEFDITESGRYQVQIGRVQGEAIVTRGLLDGQASNLVLGLASGFVFLASAAALTISSIVVTVRRRRTERAPWAQSAAIAAGPPPGWAPAAPMWTSTSDPPPPGPPRPPGPPPPPWRPNGS